MLRAPCCARSVPKRSFNSRSDRNKEKSKSWRSSLGRGGNAEIPARSARQLKTNFRWNSNQLTWQAASLQTPITSNIHRAVCFGDNRQFDSLSHTSKGIFATISLYARTHPTRARGRPAKAQISRQRAHCRSRSFSTVCQSFAAILCKSAKRGASGTR
jgi:hypothetical protein